jgi:hypothetical protein
MKIETYGQKKAIDQVAARITQIFQKREGYTVIGSTHQMQKDLKKQGMTR